MIDDLEYFELLELIESLNSKVKKVENILIFHKLDVIANKYKKVFPQNGECPYFEAKGFKEFIPEVFPLSCFKNLQISEPEFPEEKFIEFKKSKERMRDYYKISKKKKREKKTK